MEERARSSPMNPQAQKVARPRESSFVYRLKADPRFSRGWHFHPEYELTAILESRGRRLVGDSIERYGSGDLVLLGPNLPHAWRSEDRPARRARRRRRGEPLHRAIVIQFDERLLGEGFLRAPELEPVASVLARAARGLAIGGRTRDEVVRRMISMRRLAPYDRLLELLKVLGAIAAGGRDLRPLSRAAISAAEGRGRGRIHRVLAWLHERYTGPVTQAAAAAQAGMTPSGFSRFFRRAAGTTYTGHLSGLRVAHAADLLRETDLPVLEVSLRSGFANLSNFNRRFLRLKGMTPREFRARASEAVR